MGGVVKSIGAGLGISKSAGEKSAARAAALFNDMEAPELRQIGLDRFRSQGDVRDFIQQQSNTQFDNVQADPSIRQKQIDALNQLGDIAENDGITDADRSRLEQIGREEAIRERGQREALLRNAQARGVAGSGLELAQQLAAQQGSADRAALRGTEVSSQAANRAFQALQAQGNMAGSLRSQDFGEAAQRAQAQDAINRFNTQSVNQAGMAQFQNLQDIANRNVGVANQETTLNRIDIPQQNFQNQLSLNQARAGALQNLGAQQAGREGRFTSLVGAGIGAALGGGKK